MRRLGLKPDRLDRADRRADQFAVGGGARSVGESEIVLEPDPRLASEQRSGGDAGGLAAAEGAHAPRLNRGMPAARNGSKSRGIAVRVSANLPST